MKIYLIAVLMILFIPVFSYSADGILPGSWEVDTSMEIQSIPSILTSTSATYCISNDEARDPRRLAFRQKYCIFTAFKKANNRLTWKMKCSGRNHGTLTGEALLGGDTFESTMKLHSGDEVSTLQVNARRLGECTRNSAEAASARPQQSAGNRE